MYYNFNSKYDLGEEYRQMKRLPQFVNMTDNDIVEFYTKMCHYEAWAWIQAEKARMTQERDETLAWIEDKKHISLLPALPKDEVKIGFGWTICPSWVDDHGFIKEDFAKGLRRTIRLSLDNKRKIYIH